MCVFSCATLSVDFLLSSTYLQVESNVSWKNVLSVAAVLCGSGCKALTLVCGIRQEPCSVAVAVGRSRDRKLTTFYMSEAPPQQNFKDASWEGFLPGCTKHNVPSVRVKTKLTRSWQPWLASRLFGIDSATARVTPAPMIRLASL